jgi:putative transposase
MGLDYRKQNGVTEPNNFQLPRFESVTDTVSSAKAEIFSTLDLMSGYFQIPLDPKDKHKTAFVTAIGQYQFLIMPFGLKNAPRAFQMVMNQAMKGLNWKSVIIYIDDTLVFSANFDHLQHLD